MDIISITKYILLYLGGTVCAENGTSVYSVFACSEFGSLGKCAGRINGNCNCPTTIVTNPPTVRPTSIVTIPPTRVPNVASPCIEGQQYCASQCECGMGYYECVNNAWLYRDLPSIIYLYI